MLRWYAVILIQWIQGMGLSNIMNKAIEYKRNDSEATVRIDGKPVKYDDSREHRNVVIADTLDVIENVILFQHFQLFLRFSNEYKRFHKVESFKNDWYEYVEYGTTNPLTILLQRSGFSRETSTYIRQHRREYVVMAEDGGVKLRRTLLQSRNLGAARESADIQYNMPEIFCRLMTCAWHTENQSSYRYLLAEQSKPTITSCVEPAMCEEPCIGKLKRNLSSPRLYWQAMPLDSHSASGAAC